MKRITQCQFCGSREITENLFGDPVCADCLQALYRRAPAAEDAPQSQGTDDDPVV